MGREEAPFYHAVRRPADAKPTFDERCSFETETYQGWFSSVGRTIFHWERESIVFANLVIPRGDS